MFDRLKRELAAAAAPVLAYAATTFTELGRFAQSFKLPEAVEEFFENLDVSILRPRPQRLSIGASPASTVYSAETTKPLSARIAPSTGRAPLESMVQLVTITTGSAQESSSAFDKVKLCFWFAFDKMKLCFWFAMLVGLFWLLVGLFWLLLFTGDAAYTGLLQKRRKKTYGCIALLMAVVVGAIVPWFWAMLGY